MKNIKIKRVICVNNEVEKHGAANLLPGDIDEKRNWLCKEGTSRGFVILELECRTVITAIRIGNAHSAFVEILVGKLGDPTDKYETLVPPSQFMSFEESQYGKNTGQVKFFYQKDFRKDVAHKEWDVIQLVCTQPFNKRVHFGICFVLVTGLGEDLVVVPERKKEEHTPSIPNITKIEPKEREKKTTAEETSESESLPKIKATSFKISSTRRGAKRKQNPTEDYPDNRRNKYIGLEFSPPKEKMAEGNEESPVKVKIEVEIKEEVEEPGSEATLARVKRERRPRRHFTRLLEDVFFTISGLKNPDRSNIRNQAMRMGARYSPVWHSRSTHLICDYKDTPKYALVKGSARIVKKEWISSCFSDKKRYPWRRFALDAEEMALPESEEEVLPEESDYTYGQDSAKAGPSSTAPVEIKKEKADEAEADDDLVVLDPADLPELPPFQLPDIFNGKVFHVDPYLKNYKMIEKYIVAYNGVVKPMVTRKVEFFITELEGTPLRILRKRRPRAKAVNPAWIYAINSCNHWVSPWNYLQAY